MKCCLKTLSPFFKILRFPSILFFSFCALGCTFLHLIKLDKEYNRNHFIRPQEKYGMEVHLLTAYFSPAPCKKEFKSPKFTMCQVKSSFPRKVHNNLILSVSFPLWSFSFLHLTGHRYITLTLGKAILIGSQLGQHWQGKVREDWGSKGCSTHTADYYRWLQLVNLFWLFLKQETGEQWPTGNVPWRRKIMFVRRGDSSHTFCKGAVIIR